MATIINRKRDPLMLRRHRDQLELRIREYSDYGTRFTYLSPAEARKLAIALLLEAEKFADEDMPAEKL
jgi:hypothetical protein